MSQTVSVLVTNHQFIVQIVRQIAIRFQIANQFAVLVEYHADPMALLRDHSGLCYFRGGGDMQLVGALQRPRATIHPIRAIAVNSGNLFLLVDFQCFRFADGGEGRRCTFDSRHQFIVAIEEESIEAIFQPWTVRYGRRWR